MDKIVYISLDIKMTGQKIRTVINERGYTVRQVQEMLNLSCPQTIYKWLNGYRLPSVDNLYRLSRIFDRHMEDLLVETGTADKDKIL